MTNFNPTSESDRDWLAFRYISGELDESEASAFEAELETSQLAREAVARAVELSQAVARAEFEQVEEFRSRSERTTKKAWLVPAGWMTAGVVAASAAALVWSNLGRWSQPENKATAGVAEAWTKSSEVVRSVGPSGADVATEETAGELRFEPATAAPSWMTAGVISLSGEKIDDDADGDGKPDESWDDQVWEN